MNTLNDSDGTTIYKEPYGWLGHTSVKNMNCGVRYLMYKDPLKNELGARQGEKRLVDFRTINI